MDEEPVFQEVALFLCERGIFPGPIEPGPALAMAVSIANGMRRNELIAERVAVGIIEEFDGKTCNDWDLPEERGSECPGWDGISHRCECGNRRVQWVISGDFRNMEITASAY